MYFVFYKPNIFQLVDGDAFHLSSFDGQIQVIHTNHMSINQFSQLILAYAFSLGYIQM